MKNFKLGDRVIYRGKDSNNPYHGRQGVVVGLGFEDNIHRVEFDDGEKWWCSGFEIELVEKVDKITKIEEIIYELKYLEVLHQHRADVIKSQREEIKKLKELLSESGGKNNE